MCISIYTAAIQCIYIMPFEPKVKLGKVGNSYRLTIPAEMIQDLGWKVGDILRIGMSDNNEKLTIHKQAK